MSLILMRNIALVELPDSTARRVLRREGHRPTFSGELMPDELRPDCCYCCGQAHTDWVRSRAH